MNNEELIMDNKKYNDVGAGLVPAQRNINKTQCKRCREEHCSSAKENRTNPNANGVGICGYAPPKGITLIALIITIIILLILAGVAINLLVGDNSLFNTASRAGEKYEKEAIKEELESVILDIQLSKNMNITMQDIIDELSIKCSGVEWIDTDSKEPIGEYKGYEFKVKDDYTVEILEKVKGDRPIRKITFEEENIKIVKDATEEIELKYKIEPKNATNKEVVWEVDKPDLLTVKDGKIVAKGTEGQVKVICKAVYGEASAECIIEIIDGTFIYTPEDFINYFATGNDFVNNNNYCKVDTNNYFIMNDLDFTGYDSYSAGNVELRGTLDGQGHIISNLKVSDGLVENSVGATIKNILFKNVYVDSSDYGASLFGKISGVLFEKVGITGVIHGKGNEGVFGVMTYYSGNASSFIECYSRTSLESSTNFSLGGAGFVVSNIVQSFRNCYFSGTVNKSDAIGTFVAGEYNSGSNGSTLTNCYYNSDLFTKSVPESGNPLTTEEFKNNENFEGWDFENTWIIKDGYPELRIFVRD